MVHPEFQWFWGPPTRKICGRGFLNNQFFCRQTSVKGNPKTMNELREPKFAEEGGSDYEVYIRTDELLAL